MTIMKDGLPITSLEDWFARAGPKSPGHWKDGRSAKETARAWLGTGSFSLPQEVESLLADSPHFGPPLTWSAEPEAKLRFDTFAGEPRNSDLLVVASDTHGDYVIAVEAKADEPFGETVAAARANAAKRKAENPRSNGLLRIEQLEVALLGPKREGQAEFDSLRYQLLTATAGALAEAQRRGVNRAVMLVHEFVTDETTDDRHAANAVDLDRFVLRLSGGTHLSVHEGEMAGPFAVPGQPRFAAGIQLFIGKVVRRMRKIHDTLPQTAQQRDHAETNQFGVLEIANSALRLADIPADEPFYWPSFADFALSFDAYASGGDDCADMAIKGEDEFRKSGTLPSTLSHLRTCLFYVQRQWRDGGDPDGPTVGYIRALLSAVRARVAG
jgi:hypothetical protein